MRTVTSRYGHTGPCEHTHTYPSALARLYALRLWTPFSWEEPAGRRRYPGPLHLCPGTGVQGCLGARPTLSLGSASCTLDDNAVQAQPSPLWLPPDRFLGKFFSPAQRDRDCGGVDSQGLPCRGPAGSQGSQEAASQAGGVWSMCPLSQSRGAAHPGPQLVRNGYQQQNAGIQGNPFLRLRQVRHFLQSGLVSHVASEFQSKDLWGHLRICADFTDVEPQLREGAGWLEGTQRQSLGSRSQGH